jgi:hypothetical protein
VAQRRPRAGLEPGQIDAELREAGEIAERDLFPADGDLS